MKDKRILPLYWRKELEDINVYSIGDDVILLDKPVITSALHYPFKVDITTAIIGEAALRGGGSHYTSCGVITFNFPQNCLRGYCRYLAKPHVISSACHSLLLSF